MKRQTLFATTIGAIVFLALFSACQRTDDIRPATQNAFRGLYQPTSTIVQMRHDLHEEGVEASIDSLTFFDRWNWSSDGRLAQVEFDCTGNVRYNGPVKDDYFYNSNGRLDSICHWTAQSVSPLRTFRFAYSGGLLSRISYPFGQNGARTYTTDFRYRNGEEYPYAIVFTHPLEEFLYNLYHTDTLVMRWTLEWDNGNLVRATADSMAWYTTGLSKIEYAYDNHPNPFQGYFNSSLISRDGIVDDPSCFCKNNLVRRTYYHYNSRDNTTSTSQSRWDYQYVRPPYPSSVTTTYHTLYWTDVTVKSYFYYDDPWADE